MVSHHLRQPLNVKPAVGVDNYHGAMFAIEVDRAISRRKDGYGGDVVEEVSFARASGCRRQLDDWSLKS